MLKLEMQEALIFYEKSVIEKLNISIYNFGFQFKEN